ncbi:MAG: trigger factor [Leptolyngbyaceae cyanobacterium SM1_1_3]|nr:trigger factor [Leptolyngbyaceae cyanobacterium SM1_1_3]NJN02022.1 trigger factor [Leptolyngbyaceae cyanobacterium RM1_1_2]NJO08299.1 trigger factor [Leptolyngbyaceae cyanobacterium SL_1_1]
MKVTQEKLPDSQIGLEIEITAEMSKQAYEQVLRKFTRSANIPGFRKGKVPRQVLLQRFGQAQVKAAAIEELVQEAIEKAIDQEEIEAIGNYQLKTSFEDLIGQYEPGQPLTFSAAVDVPPRISLAEYRNLSVQAEEIQHDPSRVNDVLTKYQENLATLVPIEDRTAQAGDVVVVDFVGKLLIEGEEPREFEGGSAEDFQLDLSEGRFIEGFIDGIIGMQPEETKEVEVTFPESYPQEDLAGRRAVFTVVLKELKEKELPDLDDEFAQEVSDFETLAELRDSLEKRYREEAEKKTKSNKDSALLEALVSNLEAEIPQTLVQREVDYLVTQTAMQLGNQGLDIQKLLTKDIVANMRERSQPEAIARLKRTLALGEVAKQEAIAVDEAEISARAEEMLAEVDDAQNVDMERLREIVREDLLKEKILAWLEENSTIELVPEGTLSEEAVDESILDAASQTVDVEAAAADVEELGQEETSEAG